MGVDYDGQGEIDAIGDAHITFSATGIGGGWVCSTPTNGGVVYQLETDPTRANGTTSPKSHPNRQGRRTVRAGQEIATFAPPAERVPRDRLGIRPGVPVTNRAPGRRVPGRQWLRRLAHRRGRQHERPDPFTRRPLRHLPQPTDRRPLPVSCATSHVAPIEQPSGPGRCRPGGEAGTPGVADGVLASAAFLKCLVV